MSQSFNQEDVRRIARLSSLELTDQETEAYAQQFTTILDYFELLKQCDIGDQMADNDESHLRGTRADEMKVSPVSPEQFSEFTQDGFFKVPKVIDTGN